ncbi:unnamed protein product [Psylliodes chrysocephalus]|uniref:Uncharacterized protein n=1 Tax=Psylliodes chrysocephalus TaxID=3402493 RepID=A0A9P0CHA1_9CUCU|nr:unnamed protein product [Psylliodes chrysocephala]
MRAIVVLVITFGSIFAATSVEQRNEDQHYNLKEKFHHNLEENIHHHHVDEKNHHHVNEKTHHHANEKTHHHLNEKAHHHANEKVHHHLNEKTHHHLNDKSHHHLKDKSHGNHGEYSHYSGHHLRHEVKHHNQGSHFFHHGYRVHENTREGSQNCRWVCDELPKDMSSTTRISMEFKVLYKGSMSLLGLEHTNLQLALVLDYKNDNILLLNGKTGVTYILSGSSQQVIRLKLSPETKDVLWDLSKSSFTEYFGKLSIENILKIGQQYGQKSDLSSLPEPLATEIGENFKNLGFPAPTAEELRFIATFASYLRNVLSLLYKGTGHFYIQNNFRWFVKINALLANLLDPSTSGIDLSKINIDPRSIFNGTSGIETFIKLFTQIGSNVDLSKLAGSIFSSRERVLKFFSDVSGGSHNGLDGLISISVNVAKALSGQGSINDVIASILKYNSTELNEPTYAQLIDQGLEIVRSQQNAYHSHAFDGIYTFLKALADNNLILSNVNIADIIKIFFSPNPLDRVSIVIKILSTFAPQRGIPHFFKFITEALNSSNPSHFLNGLVPGLNVSQFGNGNVLQTILQGRNITQLLSGGGNISSILSQIPVLGQYLNPQYLRAMLSGNFGNLTSGNIFGQIFNSSQGGGIASSGSGGIASSIQNGIQGLINASQSGGGSGGIASGIQNGIQGLINASQSGGGSGGIAGSIQNGIGNLFGVTAQAQAQGSTQSSGSEATTSKPEESSEAGASVSGAEVASTTPGSKEVSEPKNEESSSPASKAATAPGPEAVTSEPEKSSGATGKIETASQPIGVQSSGSGPYLSGGFTGGVSFHDRHRAQNKHHNAHNHNQKSEDKLHGKKLHQ